MTRDRLAAWLVAPLSALSLACGVDAPGPPPRGGPIVGAVARLDVAPAVSGLRGLPVGEAARTAAIVRQSARDWLEHAGRLAPDGELSVDAALDSLRLRGPLTTWLLAWAVAPDHLGARVVVRRSGRSVAEFPIRVESALAGFAWRDREDRLERLARRLGQRLAARLDSRL